MSGGQAPDYEAELTRMREEIEHLSTERRAARAEQYRLRLRLQELGTALRARQEGFLNMLDRLQEREEHAVRRAREALARSEEQYRFLLESITNAFFAIDPDWRFTYVNRRAEDLLNKRQEELMGRDLWEAFPEAVGSVFHREYQRAMEERTPVQFEEYYPPLRGWFEVRASPSPEGLSVLFTDITERKRAEERVHFLAEAGAALGASLDYGEAMITVARLAVAHVADCCLIEVLADGEFDRVAAVHRDPGKQEQLERVWPRTRNPADVPRSHPIRTGKPVLIADATPHDLERLIPAEASREQGRLLDVRSLMGVPLISRSHTIGMILFVAAESGHRYGAEDLALARELAGRIASVIDNTRLYRQSETARAEAEQRREQLEQVMQSRERLMRGFTHDVKNPLGAADGHLQLLDDGILGPLPQKQKDSVDRARRSIRSALRLINDLVDLARAEAGRIEVHPELIDVLDAVRDTVEEYRASAEAKGLYLAIQAPDEDLILRSDPDKVRQILGNLVSNAVKYTDEGGVTLRAEPRSGRDAPGPGRWLAMDVADTGRGIPEEEQASLFQEFQRLGPGTESGTGLGLAISQRIAEVLGGRITVASARGEGSTFSLWLPLDQDVEPTQEEA